MKFFKKISPAEIAKDSEKTPLHRKSVKLCFFSKVFISRLGGSPFDFAHPWPQPFGNRPIRFSIPNCGCGTAALRLIQFVLLLFCIFLFQTVHAEDQLPSCGTKCHVNPQLIKENKNKLKECSRCHGPSTHNRGSAVSITQYAGNAGNFKDMVYIPEGEFVMGTDERFRDEKPAHVVYVAGFHIDIFEVTNEEYKKFVDHTAYSLPERWKKGTFPEKKARHPVNFVSWHDANNYCKWAGKRLPRETEWEKAARGTDSRVYPWGNKWDKFKSNNPLRALGDTQPIGTYENGKSPYGLYDMSGNVWEWVDDHYYAHPGSDFVNPEFGDKYRLLKGGSFWDCSSYGCGISAPVYNRAFFEPAVKGETYGFRCAKDKPL